MPLTKKTTKTLLGQISFAGVLFFAGMLCIVGGAQYQGELLGTGSTRIGKGSAYVTLTGSDAQMNINFFWIGGVVFILAALIQLIIAVRREFKNPLPFENDSKVFLICPKCEKPFSSESLEKAECPDCQVDLVQLKEFYDNRKN